jgi:hypothetical protein
MVTLFSLAALSSISFASAPRAFVISQRTDSGTNLECYYKIDILYPIYLLSYAFVLRTVSVAQTWNIKFIREQWPGENVEWIVHDLIWGNVLGGTQENNNKPTSG